MSGGISGIGPIRFAVKVSCIGVIRGIGSRDKVKHGDRWHKAVRSSNSGGTITDKAV